MSERNGMHGTATGTATAVPVVGRARARGPGRARGLVLAAACLVAACGAGPSATQEPTATPTPVPTAAPTPTASPDPAATAPAGTTLTAIAEAGVAVPVPEGWRAVSATELADPAVQAELAAGYPGAGDLLAAIGELDGWASPAFLAVDPSPASRSGPLAANLSVLVAQPSVGGALLDFVAGMIGSSVADVLGAEPPTSQHVQLAAGEAVRLTYDVPAADGREVRAVSWVIGAPSGTLLVTVMGTADALAGVDPGAIAAAIVPVAVGE